MQIYVPCVANGAYALLSICGRAEENLAQYDCVAIITDHSDYDYQKIVAEAQLVIDTPQRYVCNLLAEDRSLLTALNRLLAS